MTRRWSCVIPGKPTQKGNQKRAIFNKKLGRAFVVPNAKTVEAESNAKGIAFSQRPASFLEGALIVDVEFVFAIPESRKKGKRALQPGDPHTQRPDRGNLLKMAEDVLEGIAYANDCAIADGRVRKIWGERDETRIYVSEIGARETSPGVRDAEISQAGRASTAPLTVKTSDAPPAGSSGSASGSRGARGSCFVSDDERKATSAGDP